MTRARIHGKFTQNSVENSVENVQKPVRHGVLPLWEMREMAVDT
jgi:hypothetical protein